MSGPAAAGTRTRTLPAPAKVNLGLHVLAKRGDGLHELDTVFATLSLADEVTVSLAAAPDAPRPAGGRAAAIPRVQGELVVEPGVPGAEELAMDDDELALRAARAYLQAYAEAEGAAPDVRVRLRKRIPVAAGLGGGSSDAGAVLRALARLLPARLDVAALALGLGSDVPFFASGLAAARARGRGERLTPLELPARQLVLVHPGVSIPAGEAYGELQSFSARLDPERLAHRLREGEPPRWLNGLQAGVMRRWPAVREALHALRDVELQAPLMSGSGSTCFGLAEDAEHAERAARELAERHPGWWVAAASLPSATQS